MASRITPQRIEELKQYLKDHPIDHAWDEEAEYFDGNCPLEQLAARSAYDLLKLLGELPEEPDSEEAAEYGATHYP